MDEGEPIPDAALESSQSGELGRIVQELTDVLGRPEGAPEPLDGGITNRNFRARFDGRDYVIRVPGKDTSLLEIDRGAERVANERAAAIGVAPAVAAALDDPPAIVTVFVEGRGMEPAELREPATLTDVARSLRADPRPREAAAHHLRLVPDRRDLRRHGARAWRDDPGRLRRGPRAGDEDRVGAHRARARPGALPQRPARRQLHPRRGPALDRRLGVRGDGRPLLRPRQLRRQQRARGGVRAGAARGLLRRAGDDPADRQRCG